MAEEVGSVVVNGRDSGTGGYQTGMNGVIPWRLFAAIIGFIFVVILINISSSAMEEPEVPLWKPALWELSSYLAIVLFVPLIYYQYRRFHWQRIGVTAFLGVQLGFCVVFSLLHTIIMVEMRKVVYQLAHEHYDFATGHLPLKLIYEGRKDALTFVVVIGFIWVYERLREQAKSQALLDRIEVKSDGRTLYLTPAEIIYAEAAGNYVELHLTTSTKPLLLRGTLSEFDKRLSAYGFVRIHRSRLLNRDHMRSFMATPSGDLRITLNDGREITASRRFRGALDA